VGTYRIICCNPKCGKEIESGFCIGADKELKTNSPCHDCTEGSDSFLGEDDPVDDQGTPVKRSAGFCSIIIFIPIAFGILKTIL
jgi:hypothetical protein